MRRDATGNAPSDEETNKTMAATLQEILLAPDRKPQVITDACTLLDNEVSDKSGISGTAVKLAYKTVNAVASGHVRHMVETLLPQMVGKLEPYWEDFNASGGGSFGDYLAKRGDEVSESLLEVTDARAANSSRATVTKAYKSVRGGAGKHIQAALPALGNLVTKYAG
jgi:hypothetical protein